MSKKIRLTWLNEGETVVEECLLISETDHCYTRGLGSGSGSEEIVEGVFEGVFETLMANGAVVFEDERGIFCLRPEQVVDIEIQS